MTSTLFSILNFTGTKNEVKYTRAQEDDEEHEPSSVEALLSITEKDQNSTRYRLRTSRRQSQIWTMLNIALFLFSLVALSYTIYGNKIRPFDKQWLLKKTSHFSPVLERLTIPTSIQQADGALYESTHPTRFRNARKPDPAVDAAWLDLELIHTFPITASDVVKLGKDPSISVKYPESYGLGSEAYVAQIDVFHQIHCLNMLRKKAWADFLLPADATEAEREKHEEPRKEMHWVHLSHCVDMLMQNLMCQGSVDVFTFNWMETQELPFPDFYMNRECRDFDAIVKWQEENGLGPDLARNFTRPDNRAGIVEVPAPKEYYEIKGDKSVG